MRSSKGIATLPVVLLISSIVMELTIAGVVLAAFLTSTVFSSKLSSEALTAARAGAQDGIMKVVRYKNCIAIPSCGGAPYTITVGSRSTASVSLVDNLDNTLTINSEGTALLTRKKKIQARVGVDPNSGKVSVLSFGEVPL